MSNALRRIISEADDVGKSHGITSQQQQQQQQEEHPPQVYPQQNQQEQQHQNSPDHQQQQQRQRANLVEMESDDFMDLETDDNAPVSHIRRSSGEYGSAHSSLSGASDTIHNNSNNHVDFDMEHDGAPPPEIADVVGDPFATAVMNNASKELLPEHSNDNPLKRTGTTATTLQRMDDESSDSIRASSQNSSRDWGWFEDVHHPSETNLPQSSSWKKKKSGSPSNKADRQDRKYATLVPLSDTVRDVRSPETDAAAMAVTAPTYVLEESLSSQRLWKDTAGQRPPQPVEERCFYEKMWAQNFSRSQVEYQMPADVLTATSPISLSPFADGNFEGPSTNSTDNYNLSVSEDPSKGEVTEAAIVSRLHESGDPHSSRHTVVNKKVKGIGSAGDLTIMVRGDNAFGTTVSKSFARPNDRGGPIQGVDTVNISIASYRVVETKNNGKYAQFLVIYREGSIRDTIGVWKRYSDFEELARKVTQSHEGCVAVIANMSPLAMTEEPEHEQLPNAMTSWRLLKKRQRWFRCLDAGYLSLKVFLLERFLHDILFESSTPNLLREFVVSESSHISSPE